MRYTDTINLAFRAITAHRLRTLLILIGIGIGVSSVILLTALGDSARRYVTGEFAALGTNLLIVLPGRSETTGGPPPLMGEPPRDLTLDESSINIQEHAEQIVELDSLLDELTELNERLGKIVEMRFFAGLSIEDTAELLDISTSTVNRDWAKARGWLYQHMRS